MKKSPFLHWYDAWLIDCGTFLNVLQLFSGSYDKWISLFVNKYNGYRAPYH